MASYLLSWNPTKWDGWKPRDLVPTANLRWSCSRRDIKPDDRVFLIRLGKDPKGIICHGVVTEGAQKDKHWDPKHAGKECRYIQFEVEGSWNREDPIILLRTLQEADNRFCDEKWRSKNWAPQKSGVGMPDAIADILLQACRDAIPSEFPDEIPPGGNLPSRLLTEGGAICRVVNSYERNQRARKECLEEYGAKCAVCGIDFGEEYGPEVEGLIHVHHLTPLQNIDKPYQIDPVKDLRPVCPNCHAVIHYKQGNSPREIDAVKEMMRRK